MDSEMEVSGGEPTAVVSPSDLTLWFCMRRDKAEQYVERGVLPRAEGGWKNLLGLREEYSAALERAQYVEGEANVSKHTHVLLQIVFTPQAVAHYTLTYAGVEFNFAPMLIKQVYTSGEKKDWKAWHFHDDLPLRSTMIRVYTRDVI